MKLLAITENGDVLVSEVNRTGYVTCNIRKRLICTQISVCSPTTVVDVPELNYQDCIVQSASFLAY